MSATVLPFEHRFAERPVKETLGFRIGANGDLVITIKRPDGIKPRPIVIDDSEVDNLLAVLTHRRNELKRKRWYASHPEDRHKTSPTPRSICRRRRDGGLRARGGCRRNRGHDGQCRDAAGDYAPAVCSHIGQGRCRIVDDARNADYLVCAHCNAPVG